jgi:hypothetical protein
MQRPSFEELEAAIQVELFEAWLQKIGWDLATFRSFAKNGIPRGWAEAIHHTLPKITPDLWPRIIEEPKLHRNRSLHKRSQSSRVNVHEPDMNDAQRLAISRGRKTTPWLAALHAKGLTQNQLASKVGISTALLSMCRRVESPRPIQRAAALKIASLIDWPADKAHWPGGFVDD